MTALHRRRAATYTCVHRQHTCTHTKRRGRRRGVVERERERGNEREGERKEEREARCERGWWFRRNTAVEGRRGRGSKMGRRRNNEQRGNPFCRGLLESSRCQEQSFFSLTLPRATRVLRDVKGVKGASPPPGGNNAEGREEKRREEKRGEERRDWCRRMWER